MFFLLLSSTLLGRLVELVAVFKFGGMNPTHKLTFLEGGSRGIGDGVDCA